MDPGPVSGPNGEDLAEEFDLDRITVYRLLRGHGVQIYIYEA